MICAEHKKMALRVLLLTLAVFLIGMACRPSSCSGEVRKRLLVLNSYAQEYVWTADIIRGISETVRDADKNVSIHYEYMDTKRVSDADYFRLLYETYRYKFRGSRFDVIIAADDDALDFLVNFRDSLFPGTPIVFCGVNDFALARLRGARSFTGVNEVADIRATLELALKLHPKTRQIVVINDTSTTGRAVHNQIMQLVPSYRGRVNFVFLENIAMPTLLATVQKLQTDSLVFYTFFLRDQPGTVFDSDESISLIAQHCAVPIYGAWDFNLGRGIVGGMLTSGYYQGKTAGAMAVRLLHGAKVEDIPIDMRSPNRYMFDYRQLRRFGIPLSKLPAESVVINRPIETFSVTPGFIWGGAAALTVLVLILVLLLLAMAIKRKAAKQIARSEERYRSLVIATSQIVWTTDAAGKVDGDLPSWREYTGQSLQEIQGFGFNRAIHPDDRERAMAVWRRAVQDRILYACEYRLLGSDGTYRYFSARGVPVLEKDGSIREWVGTCADITESKQAEEDLRLLTEELERRVEERTEELLKSRKVLEQQNELLQRTYQELQLETADRIRVIKELRAKEQLLAHQSRMAAMGDMLGNIAHQWRQPLNVLGLKIQEIGLSYKLGRFSKELLDVNIAKAMEILSHLSKTIDAFRTFSTPDQEKIPFKVGEVIAKTVALIDESFRQQGIAVEIDNCGDLEIEGYPNQYAQVLLNILMNSRDAFQERQISDARITVRSRKEDGRVEVVITDNAGGIAEDIMDKVFDPYFTTKVHGKGTGIGLFMSKTIIEKSMEGSLVVRNTGNGVEFRITV